MYLFSLLGNMFLEYFLKAFTRMILSWNASGPPCWGFMRRVLMSFVFKLVCTDCVEGVKVSGWNVRLKKKKLCLKACENFSNRRGMRFFILFFFTSIGLCLHAHPKPKMTEKFQLPYFQKSNGILHVFWTPTCLNSSKTANFLRFS